MPLAYGLPTRQLTALSLEQMIDRTIPALVSAGWEEALLLDEKQEALSAYVGAGIVDDTFTVLPSSPANTLVKLSGYITTEGIMPVEVQNVYETLAFASTRCQGYVAAEMASNQFVDSFLALDLTGNEAALRTEALNIYEGSKILWLSAHNGSSNNNGQEIDPVAGVVVWGLDATGGAVGNILGAIGGSAIGWALERAWWSI